ncbi:GAP family protein [Microtetraspora fusca]|uniref:GAP family protein n=1 Tax=Microtetraspora fusca TaxID=1997 RepID=A0ABW6VG11_MICFU|nr:GAP family protein [Microtetraspora fusca]
MNLQVLPLAVTMMMGPQIMCAIILVTAERARACSLAFLVGVAAATTVGVAIARGLFGLIGGEISPAPASRAGSSVGTAVQIGLVALLLAVAVKNYVRRDTAEPPKWLRELLGADPWKAFTTGFLVILLMPSDILVMLTVGANLAQTGAGPAAVLPFIGATVAVAALPLLGLLLFRGRAERAMPKVREWMESHGWLINIFACLIFIALIL